MHYRASIALVPPILECIAEPPLTGLSKMAYFISCLSKMAYFIPCIWFTLAPVTDSTGNSLATIEYAVPWCPFLDLNLCSWSVGVSPFFLTEGWLLYRILLFSAKLQHESAIGIHIAPSEGQGSLARCCPCSHEE